MRCTCCCHAGHRYEAPGSPHSPFYPLRGLYSSRDPAVLADHIMELSHAGCHVLVSHTGASLLQGAPALGHAPQPACMCNTKLHSPAMLHAQMPSMQQPGACATTSPCPKHLYYMPFKRPLCETSS
jgi:hypothetical protein